MTIEALRGWTWWQRVENTISGNESNRQLQAGFRPPRQPWSLRPGVADPNAYIQPIRSGAIGSYILSLGSDDPAARNTLQEIATKQSRLGIPLIFGFDTIHGLRTVFPIPLAISCTWDPALFEKLEAVAARESRAAEIDWVFGPMCDLARDPRWGRVAETFGEDPYLASLKSGSHPTHKPEHPQTTGAETEHRDA